MSSIRRKSGLDYLTRTDKSTDASEGGSEAGAVAQRAGGNMSDEHMQKAIFTTGRQILVTLRDLPGRKAELNQLVDKTNIDKDELTPVVDKLADLKWVQYVTRDKYGNHTIEITQDGLATV
jgi:hypothetical protein